MVRPAMEIGAVLAFAGLSLGCAGWLQPEVHFEDVVAFECGEWEATVVADAPFGGTIEVDVDERQRRHAWTVSGDSRQAISGTGDPGSEVQLVARLGAAGAAHVLQLPPTVVTAELTGDLRDDRDGTLVLDLDSVCAGPVRWRVVGPGVDVSGKRAGGAPTQVAVARLPAGPTAFELSVSGNGVVGFTEDVTVLVAGPCVDADADGHGVCADEGGRPDCDDSDPHVFPGAVEKPVPNSIDDNCDGRVDEGTVAFDDDGDGFAEEEGDCDDADVDRYPGNPERWDCRDQDCDGEVDEGTERERRGDSHEPNDTREDAVSLGGGNSVSVEVEIVRGPGDDPEWFTFYSSDGPFDSWGIGVRAVTVPDLGSWSVDIFDASSLRHSHRLERDGESGWLIGKGMRDDSGTYWVRLTSSDVPESCPATFRIVGR